MTVFTDRRARLLQEMAGEGLDVLLLYGNAWQNDYLRYATDFGILEGQALAIVREDGITLYLDSALEADRAALECTGIEVVHAPDLLGEVDKALNRLSNRRIGTAPARLIPRRLAARAKDLNLGDRTAFLDRLLMGKLASEVDAIRRACKVADEGYAVFRDAARPGRADYELIAEAEAFFRSKGVDDNFQIIGVGGPEVRGMAPPSGKKLKRGDMVTTELTPCVDGYYAQICRTLVVGEPNAEQNKALRALSRGDGGRHRRGARRRHRRRHRARRERRVPPRGARRLRHRPNTPACAATASGLFADTKPHILEDVTTRIDAGMTLIVHPNTYHPVVGYLVLGDVVAVTKEGCEVFTGDRRASCSACRREVMRHAPRLDGMECGGIAEGGARGAHRAAARGDAARRLRRRAVLHQPGAAERGDLAHRLHAVLVRRHAAAAARRRAGVRDRAVEARRQLDPHHRYAERDRQHAEAGRRGRQAASRMPAASASACWNYDALPAGLFDEIAGAAPAVELADMRGVFADVAAHASTMPSAA